MTETHPPRNFAVNRRSLLFSGGAAAAGAMLLQEAVAQERNPAAQVADRTSTIMITSVRAMPVGTKAYVKIETNHGGHWLG